jgi:MFS family permease
VGSYTELLRTPGVGRIIAAQLTARFPFGMLSLAFLLHVEHVHDSYAAAGLVLGSMSIGQAIAGPLTSRLMGRLGMRRVLTLTLIVCAAAIIAMAVLPLEVWQFVAIGFLAGLSMPPVQPAVRTIYPKMVPSSMLTPLFSLDASAQEIIWVLGPVLTTFVSIQISTVAGILTAAVFLIGGGIWFIASPEVGRVRIPRSKRRIGVVLTKPPVLLATVVGFLLVGACAAVEAGVVAVFGEGSLVGGLTLGHIPISRWATARRMLIVTVGMGLAAFSTDFWWLSITLFLAGVGIAPALAALFTITAASVKFSDTAEAYGWVGTGQLIGAALGSAIAGVQIDGNGPTAAIVVAAVFAFVGFVVPAVGRRYHPDLRGRDSSPLPDTEPVELPT